MGAPRLLRTLARSTILEILPRSRLARFALKPVPGRVVWFNFELARTLGLTRQRRMTPPLARELVAAVSLQLARRGSRVGYADEYGGTHLHHRGSARGGFLEHGDLFLKGIGRTPLFEPGADFIHSHGKLSIIHAIVEAISGEVNHHLFETGGARVLAIIDQGRAIHYPDGAREPASVLVRAGTALRPAHAMTAKGTPHPPLDLFCRLAGATGQLVRRDGRPDLFATAMRLVEDHARTAAEQLRWRIVHGGLSTSNMQLDGGMLDTTMQSSLPVPAPFRTCNANNPGFRFGYEHHARAAELRRVYEHVRQSLDARERRAYHAPRLNFARAMREAYAGALALEWLSAAGLDPAAARRARQAHPRLVRAFAGVLGELSRSPPLRRRSVLPIMGRMPVHPSALDVHALLTAAPALLDETARVRLTAARRALGLRAGASRWRSVTRLLGRFWKIYARLFAAVAGSRPRARLLQRMAKRARFQNRPLERLYRPELFTAIWRELEAYERTGRAEPLVDFISDTIAGSARKLPTR